MKVKFSRCNSNKLSDVPIVDGQLIYVKDTQEVYMDVSNDRSKVTDILFKPTLNSIQNANNLLSNKLYFIEETNKLYHYNSTSQELEEVKTTAEATSFDPGETGIEAENVEDAIKEVNEKVDEVNDKIGDLSSFLDNLNGEVI